MSKFKKGPEIKGIETVINAPESVSALFKKGPEIKGIETGKRRHAAGSFLAFKKGPEIKGIETDRLIKAVWRQANLRKALK